MKAVEEMQQAILKLSESNYARLRRWFCELDWDTEIRQDSLDGKLDFLVAQAAQAKADGTLREL